METATKTTRAARTTKKAPAKRAGKPATGATAATKGKVPAKATKAATAPAKAATAPAIKVVAQPEKPFSGKRSAFWAELQKWDGKPLAEFYAWYADNPIAIYGPRSEHAGKPEAPAGWVGFYVRRKLISIG